jgi:hypothetical protein
MANEKLQLRAELLIGHGTAQGIIARFYMQPEQLSEMVTGNAHDQISNIKGAYFVGVVTEITHLYDLYHEIQNLITDYKAGVEKGKFFTVDQQGHTNLETSNELKVRKLVNEFFIKGKIVLTNFAKCDLIKDGSFDFSKFYFCDDRKFADLSAKYLAGRADLKYLVIIELIKRNRKFLSEFNKIRGAIEHDGFKIDKFDLIRTKNAQYVVEPILNNKYLSDSLKELYEALLEFIEKAVCYFLGINLKSGYPMRLVVNPHPDFPNMVYRYEWKLMIAGLRTRFPTEDCTFD